ETNNYGFYSISMVPGKYVVRCSYVGFETYIDTLSLIESYELNIEMVNNTKMKGIEITAERADQNIKGTEMGTVSLSASKIKTLPVIFGETDILKALQLLPGVQSAGEGNSGFYVRGGGPDQNLILLDDAVVYN